jgi:glycosyltransferase involved in cell wall biosynthesis
MAHHGRLNILSIAYPFAPVCSNTAGGAEQILAMLDRDLTLAGHRSIVLAAAGSEVCGELVEGPRVNGSIDIDARVKVYHHYRSLIAEIIDRTPVDLIHIHGLDFENYLPPDGPPVIVTLHLPISWYSRNAFETSRPRTYFVCVSKSQLQTCPPLEGLLGHIDNGVEMQLGPPLRRRNFVCAMGRICPEKGFHLAIEAARLASVPLLIAGQLYRYPLYERYYYQTLLPLLDNRLYRFIGSVAPRSKRRLLASARCVLIPSLAAETSSLVAMEAMACGTAVVAFANGALRDIVEHGKTGLIVSDTAEMARAIGAAQLINPETCIETARCRFSSAVMIEKYLALYERILENSTATVDGNCVLLNKP